MALVTNRPQAIIVLSALAHMGLVQQCTAQLWKGPVFDFCRVEPIYQDGEVKRTRTELICCVQDVEQL